MTNTFGQARQRQVRVHQDTACGDRMAAPVQPAAAGDATTPAAQIIVPTFTKLPPTSIPSSIAMRHGARDEDLDAHGFGVFSLGVRRKGPLEEPAGVAGRPRSAVFVRSADLSCGNRQERVWRATSAIAPAISHLGGPAADDGERAQALPLGFDGRSVRRVRTRAEFVAGSASRHRSLSRPAQKRPNGRHRSRSASPRWQ